MIRRALAMMIAIMFWSVQAADALVVHVSSDVSSTISIVDDGSKVDQQLEADTAGETDTGGPMTCNDGCACHVLHHFFFAAWDIAVDLPLVSPTFAYGRDPAPTRIASRLNRPPLT